MTLFPAQTPSATVRSAELAANLASVRARVAAAARAANRDPDEIELLAVSKTFPASDVVALTALGQRGFGENRHQEAAPKVELVATGIGTVVAPGVRWHFLGQVQRNKARAIVAYADVVQTVDRGPLVAALDRGAQDRGRAVDILLQVDLEDGADPNRGGAKAADLPRLADEVAAAAGLVLCGLMAVAPQGQAAEPAFARLAEMVAELRRQHPSATVLSVGMSTDLEPAIAAGSTLVRAGTALFGRRVPALG